MELYHVQFEELENIDIFARSVTDAERLVDIYLDLNSASGSSYFITDPVGLPQLGRLEHYQLLAAAAKNTEGLGLYDQQTGWTIVPLSEHPLKPTPEAKQ